MAERKGGYSFDFILEDPPCDLICLICRLVAREPHQASCCGKLFCESCLERWTLSKTTCPHCQQDLTCRHFRDTRAVHEIADLAVYCPNKSLGCLWTGEVREVKNHLRDCPHRTHGPLLECVNNCGAQLREEEVENHMLACPYAKVECNQCGEKVQRCQLHQHLHERCCERQYRCPRCHVTGGYSHMTTEHLSHCPNLSLPCPNEECQEMIYIDQVDEHLRVCTAMTLNQGE